MGDAVGELVTMSVVDQTIAVITLYKYFKS